MAHSNPTWKIELILAVSLLAVGLVLVPAAVYWLGGAVAGDYAGEGGIWGLMTSIWADAGRGRPGAWLLLLAPYLGIQLLRLAWLAMRSTPAVTDITKTEKFQ